MFTGIIEATGFLTRIEPHGQDMTVEIRAPQFDFAACQVGDSIAVNGICLTAVSYDQDSFNADVSVETLRLTTLQSWRPGQRVNLERALTPTSLLGGHLVSGHIDGIATLIAQTPDARSMRLRFRAPAVLAKYIAEKGSITIDGTSLTVNSVDSAEFNVNIVARTQQRTIIGDYRIGQSVNLEVDLLARYLERLLHAEFTGHEAPSAANANSDTSVATKLTIDRLQTLGY